MKTTHVLYGFMVLNGFSSILSAYCGFKVVEPTVSHSIHAVASVVAAMSYLLISLYYTRAEKALKKNQPHPNHN